MLERRAVLPHEAAGEGGTLRGTRLGWRGWRVCRYARCAVPGRSARVRVGTGCAPSAAEDPAWALQPRAQHPACPHTARCGSSCTAASNDVQCCRDSCAATRTPAGDALIARLPARALSTPRLPRTDVMLCARRRCKHARVLGDHWPVTCARSARRCLLRPDPPAAVASEPRTRGAEHTPAHRQCVTRGLIAAGAALDDDL